MPTIAAAPFPYEFPAHGLALIVIDMQRDFLEPGGFGEAWGTTWRRWRRLFLRCVSSSTASVPSDGPLSIRKKPIALISRTARRPNASVVSLGCVSATPARWDASSLPVNRATTLCQLWRHSRARAVLEKPGKGAFYRTNLQELLTAMNVTHLIMAGVTTEVCVQTTMREANDRGYECLLVEDATASYFPTFKQATLDMIRAQGAIVGWTATAADVLRALEQCQA